MGTFTAAVFICTKTENKYDVFVGGKRVEVLMAKALDYFKGGESVLYTKFIDT